ncbi:hypothetical protein FRB99_004866 [Tulasnella sp. 403]|nr:hypothetical protein FRB99_004866 [Tulasnella sp. 403]
MVATVHSLPLEIIAEVVHFVLHGSNPYPAALHRLAQVCTRWRDLILSYPPFWAIIDEAFGERWAEWAVKRAKNVPLTFLCMSHSPEASDGWIWPLMVHDSLRNPERLHRMEAFVNCLLQNLHRCDVVVVASNADSTMIHNTVQQILHTPNLSLSSFVFCMCSHRSSHKSLSEYYPSRIAKKTRTMVIPVAIFRDGSPLAKNLTDLKLFGGVQFDDSLLIALVNTLQACPTLESLELDDVGIPKIPSTMLPTLHLPELHRLVLTHVPGDLAYVLLPLVDAPSCKVLSMSLTSHSDEPRDQVYDMLDAPVLRTVCQNMDRPLNIFDTFRAQVATDPEDQIGVSITPRWFLDRLGLFVEDVEDELRAFQKILSLLPDRVFYAHQLELSLFGHSPSVYSAFASRFPLIDSITVEIREEGCWEGFLEFLTTHRLPSDGHIVWPDLGSLIVAHEIGGGDPITIRTELLVKFLQTRSELLHQQSLGLRPRKFRKLHFKGEWEGLKGVNWADLVMDFKMDEFEEEGDTESTPDESDES